MKIQPFKLERYFARYEFSAKYLLCSSDCDGLAVSDLLSLADEETRMMWQELKVGYTESSGLPLLRQEITKLYQGISQDEVLIAAPEELIYIAMSVLLDKGDHVICTYPGYQSLYEIAHSMGCEVAKWVLDEEKDWGVDLTFLEKNIKPNTKLIVVNFPHNPTGSLINKEDFQKLAQIAKAHDLYLFSDEMYRFLEFNSQDRLPSASEIYDKAISLFGMSKTFGMAGVRIGWLLTRDKNIFEDMKIFKDYTTICSSAPSEILSLIALRARNKIIKNHLDRVERNLNILDIFFEKYKKIFSWHKPKAGTIGFPKLNGNIDSLAFCQDLVEKSGIMLLPSTVYDFDSKHFRIGFGRENMPEVLKIFEKYIVNNG